MDEQYLDNKKEKMKILEERLRESSQYQEQGRRAGFKWSTAFWILLLIITFFLTCALVLVYPDALEEYLNRDVIPAAKQSVDNFLPYLEQLREMLVASSGFAALSDLLRAHLVTIATVGMGGLVCGYLLLNRKNISVMLRRTKEEPADAFKRGDLKVMENKDQSMALTYVCFALLWPIVGPVMLFGPSYMKVIALIVVAFVLRLRLPHIFNIRENSRKLDEMIENFDVELFIERKNSFKESGFLGDIAAFSPFLAIILGFVAFLMWKVVVLLMALLLLLVFFKRRVLAAKFKDYDIGGFQEKKLAGMGKRLHSLWAHFNRNEK